MSSTSPISILSKPKAVELRLHCSRGMLLRVANLTLVVLTMLPIDPGIYRSITTITNIDFYVSISSWSLIFLHFPPISSSSSHSLHFYFFLLLSVCFLSLILCRCEDKRKFVSCVKMHDSSSCQPTRLPLSSIDQLHRKKLQIKKNVFSPTPENPPPPPLHSRRP